MDEDDDHLLHGHTQFLDLTNGEGGDRAMYYDGEEDDDAEYHEILVPPPSAGAVSRRNNNNSMSNNNNNINAPPPAPSSSSTRVVESGQEHTGRWTREEHEAFLSALEQYGKEWKKVAAKVKTRTVVQTRTHAQKYFQKMMKTVDHTEDGQRVNPGDSLDTMAEGKKASAQKKQRKAAKAAAAAAAATSAAAHLLTSLPSTIPQSSLSSQQQQQQHQQQQQNQQATSTYPTYPTHGFSTAATTLASLPPPPAYSAPTPPQQHQPTVSTSYFGTKDSLSSWGPPSTNKTAMSIKAPDARTILRGGFPEPSPAACGTRKLAELAAAQMLAGVAASGAKSTMSLAASRSSPPENEQNHHPVDGDVTPPPPLSQSRESRYTPPPRMGLSLQIVNPESLGITYNETRRRIREGEPTTPWDGQLEQLIT